MSYKLAIDGVIDTAQDIFLNKDSSLYKDYLAWIDAGNTPEAADVAPEPSALDQIRALEAQHADAQARMTRKTTLASDLDRACAAPDAAGMSRAEVHEQLMETDPGYAALYTLEQLVADLREQM
jgi:hypothetical protein